MLARVDLRDSSFFTWNDDKLEELSHPTKYVATVEWPNGETGLVDFFINTRYEGYNDDRHQEAFLFVEHKGFYGFLELTDRDEASFKMITKLEMVKYA